MKTNRPRSVNLGSYRLAPVSGEDKEFRRALRIDRGGDSANARRAPVKTGQGMTWERRER